MATTVVTGVSRGLGAALFDGLTRRGHRVLAIGRRFTAAQRTLADDEPGRVRLRTADLSDPTALVGRGELAEFLDADTDGPLVLIHNAGSVEPVGAVGTLDATRITGTTTVNLVAPMLLTNEFLAAAGGTRPVRILYVSSGAAARPIGGWATYCATKAGAEMFFNTLAEQYADQDRVRVANVNPGVMDTDMQAVLRGHGDVYFPSHARFVGLAERGELPSPVTVAADILSTHLDTD